MALLRPGDPPPFGSLNIGGTSRALLLCDHASCLTPKSLDNLGLTETQITEHIGWDIGAGAVTRRLSALLDAQALLAGYSRLVVDCNRPEKAPDRVPEVSDTVRVPGNIGLATAKIEERVSALFNPYHDAVRASLDHMLAAGTIPFIIAIHSFTPHMSDNKSRPWEISICSNKDRRTAVAMISLLRAEGLMVGDNEPYGFGPLTDYTVPEHAESRGLPHILLEIRNDQIRTSQTVEFWSQRLAGHLQTLMDSPETQIIGQPTSNHQGNIGLSK